MIKLLKSVIFCAAIFVFAISCGGGSSKYEEGVLRLNVGPEPQTIDPTLNSAIDGSMYIIHAFEGLATKDKEGKIVGGVAESWDISDNGTKYVFHIRSNAKWSDGKPVTANDFVYSWRRATDPKTAANYSYQMEPLKNAKKITAGEMPVDSLGVKALDDNTLEVTLEAPIPYFDQLMAYPVYFPLRQDIIEANPDSWTMSPETYIGNGPFKMTERSIDDRIVMEVNTNYWNISAIVPKKLIFVLMDNGTSVVAGIKEGSIYFSDRVPTQDMDVLKEEGYLQIKPYLALYYYSLNNTNDTLKDVRVRKALSLAIDRNYIVEQVTRGGQIPAAAVVPALISDVSGSFRTNGGDYYSVKPEDYTKNVEEAKKLLAEAGYPDGQGFPVLDFKTNPGEHTSIFEAIQQMWKNNLGIDSTISSEEWAVFQQTRLDKSYVIARNAWVGDYDDPMTFLGMFLSHSAQNVECYNSPQYDALLAQASSTGDNNVRMPILHKAEDLFMSEMPIIPLYFYTLPVLVNPNLKDVQYDVLGKHKFFYAYLENNEN
ncbi:peptide ABC transporter substrate-binding protein [Brachyspira intermedia]|uniref:peptide ABC transporter substrate-binding protein n=1 Tax=Brachyspira intermedia TaxID=84377 RepID=UPI0030077016